MGNPEEPGAMTGTGSGGLASNRFSADTSQLRVPESDQSHTTTADGIGSEGRGARGHPMQGDPRYFVLQPDRTPVVRGAELHPLAVPADLALVPGPAGRAPEAQQDDGACDDDGDPCSPGLSSIDAPDIDDVPMPLPPVPTTPPAPPAAPGVVDEAAGDTPPTEGRDVRVPEPVQDQLQHALDQVERNMQEGVDAGLADLVLAAGGALMQSGGAAAAVPPPANAGAGPGGSKEAATDVDHPLRPPAPSDRQADGVRGTESAGSPLEGSAGASPAAARGAGVEDVSITLQEEASRASLTPVPVSDAHRAPSPASARASMAALSGHSSARTSQHTAKKQKKKTPFTRWVPVVPRGADGAAPQGAAPAGSPDSFSLHEFPGLMFDDGIDSCGRPVVVLDFAAFPRGSLFTSGMAECVRRIAPLAYSGDYVLVIVGSPGHSLPLSYALSAYTSLSRPIRKNIKHLVLVRPSWTLRWVIKLLSPFAKAKGRAKLKVVPTLEELGWATEGEVLPSQLGGFNAPRM
ncbi:unnamed protein product [Pedinophyceae sp. YPF-701]|nr:unnamed protein product [Pedinophyceae sp. YPF-701]